MSWIAAEGVLEAMYIKLLFHQAIMFFLSRLIWINASINLFFAEISFISEKKSIVISSKN